jgi:nucleoside-diphosphate-sugar epimerase
MNFEKVAVTGANGLLGRATVHVLSGLTDVVSLDIAPGRSNQTFRYVDVASLDALREALKGVDAVVHLAALQVEPRQERIFTLNTVGTWNVMQAAKEQGVVKVILVSSECAVGFVTLSGGLPAFPDYLPIDESHPLRPSDAYGVSKETTEAIGRAFARQSDLQVVVLRPTTVYAPGMEEDMRQARNEDDPYFWLYVEVTDVAQAVRLALDYEGPAYDCFFVSARDTFAPEETLSFMARRFGRLPEIKNPSLYARAPFATIYDVTRAEKVLGLIPASDWRRYTGDGEGHLAATM